MSLTHLMFKPKYGIEIVRKVLSCFCDEHLRWHEYGAEWELSPLNDKEGWLQLTASPSYDGADLQGFSESAYSDEPLTGKELTEDMMILLVEADVAYKREEDSENYILEDVELTQVVAALSNEDSHVFSAWDNRCFVYNVKTGEAKHHDMTDLIFSLVAT